MRRDRRGLTPAPALWALLDAERSALDRLVGEASDGTRDQRHYDDLEERGRAIAHGIIGAFRKSR